MSPVAHQLNMEMASMAESASRALVEVRLGGRRGGAGAGIIWHPQGLIVTNAHVASRGSLRVTLPGGATLPARLLAHDKERDLAALMVDATGLPTIEIGNSKDLRPGQLVMALGHPWGVKGAATAGVVIGVGSGWPEMAGSPREWIGVSLRLRPGHSGGPLIDADHRLVGINTLMAGPEVGMAVPVHVVKAFLKETLGAQEALLA
jgi:serine protease Do